MKNLLLDKKLFLILLVYFCYVCIFGYPGDFVINPDGISYLSLARFIAEGHFRDSVTGYWAPLISWCLAPLLYFNFDSLLAVKIVLGLFGALFIVAVRLLANRFPLTDAKKYIICSILAITVAQWAIYVIVPDILLAALLILYFYFVTDDNILINKRLAFLCGILGAFSYFAKAYALPFFLVHYPFTLLWKWYSINKIKKTALNSLLRPLSIGMGVFLILASCWIFLISQKYGHFTTGASYRINHAIIGPYDTVNRYHPGWIRLNKPPGKAIHSWVDPTQMTYLDWSPFESKKFFFHQVNISVGNFWNIFKNVYSLGSIVGISALILLPLIFFFGRKSLDSTQRWLLGWILITLSIYWGGFLIVKNAPVRYHWPLFPLIVLFSFYFLQNFQNNEKSRLYSLFRVFLISIFTWSFLLNVGFSTKVSNKSNIYKAVGDRLKGEIGPFATVRVNSYYDWEYLNTGYYAYQQYFGYTRSNNIDSITKELNDVGVKYLMIFNTERLNPTVESLKKDQRYELKLFLERGSIKEWNKQIYIFFLKDLILVS